MDPATLALLAAVGAGAAWYMGWLPMGGGLLRGTAARDYIIQRFQSAGLSYNLAVAAATNSYVESAGWQGDIISGFRNDDGVRENSVGLFQLNAVGLGKGCSLPLMGQQGDEYVNPADPRLNASVQCDVIIAACKANSAVMERQATGTAAELVTLFCINIERPANALVESVHRVEVLRSLFPGVA